MSLVCVTTEGHSDVHDLSCNLKPCCLLAVQPPVVILILVACDAAQGHGDIWVLLKQGAVFVVCLVTRNCIVAMICAPANSEEQEDYFCPDINDCRCTVEREEHGRLL